MRAVVALALLALLGCDHIVCRTRDGDVVYEGTQCTVDNYGNWNCTYTCATTPIGRFCGATVVPGPKGPVTVRSGYLPAEGITCEVQPK